MMKHNPLLKLKHWLGLSKAREQLNDVLHQVKQEKALDPEVVMMMEAILKLSNRQVRDVMIPRANMRVILHTDTYQQALTKVLAAKHSRYPVICDTKDEVIGLLLAKNMLLFHQDGQPPPQDITAICLPARFVPESQRLDSLLKDFKKNHTHMAIVMDEYGGVSGLITLEDVIEEITGEIEDEDYDDANAQTIKHLKDNDYLISGLATLEEVNAELHTSLQSNVVDTFGGYIAQQLGAFPKPKQTFHLNGLTCKIEHADEKRIRFVRVCRHDNNEGDASTS